MSLVSIAFLSQTAPEGGPFGGGQMPFLMMLAIVGVFYFLVIRPQSKERKKVETYRQNMKRGDKVWTQGGLVGTVFQVEDQTVLIDVGVGKIRVLKQFVGGEWKEKGEASDSKAEAKK